MATKLKPTIADPCASITFSLPLSLRRAIDKRRHAMKPPIGRSEYAQRVFAADISTPTAAKP